jgi:uncharacterized membrane protein YdjX (TVP38/TMEM64 family)
MTQEKSIINKLSKSRLVSKLKLIVIASSVIIAIAISRYFHFPELLQTALAWFDSLGFAGSIAFIVIYNIATLLFIPGSLLSSAGGCLFGMGWGSVYVLIAAVLGATWAFLCGRYLSRAWVYRKISKYPQFQAIDRAIAREGWKIVLLTRLSPIFPFNLLNYAFGVTQVSFKDYLIGSFGMIPGAVMYVYLGALAGDLATLDRSHPTIETQTIQWIVRSMGLIATIATTIYITRLAQQALAQSISDLD